jgi:hypothetical protein
LLLCAGFGLGAGDLPVDVALGLAGLLRGGLLRDEEVPRGATRARHPAQSRLFGRSLCGLHLPAKRPSELRLFPLAQAQFPEPALAHQLL